VAGGLANIGGVCTEKSVRGLGYASQTVSDLCAMLLSQGLTCSLSFNNPAAGSIYKRMGFKEVGHICIAVK
jgi:predicted GNAT family acetyltransferase